MTILVLANVDESSHNSWIGRRLGGRYEILDVIGEGGMGVVYRAKQVSVDRVVAIKMMHARAAQDPQWVDRFHSEAKACSLLTHPNTVRLYDFGQTTLGNLYMVMEFLEGRSLRQVIHDEGAMPASRVLRILMQCSASLSEAHAAGVIHRDIKPENIIVQDLAGASDFIKLFDFSIAKRTDVAMTAAGMVFGTPQFMSPEQARGKNIDHRSDLYSLGVVAYAMLTASLPFHHRDPIEVLKMHQTSEVPPLPDYVPSSVARVVMACLEKEPSRRPASALALLEASKVWLTHLDPTLDVASDPVLKNTLITGHPSSDDQVTLGPAPRTEALTRPAFSPSTSNAKTILSASGASDARTDFESARQRSASTSPIGPASETAAVENGAETTGSGKRSDVRKPANSMIATMVQDRSASASVDSQPRAPDVGPAPVSQAKPTSVGFGLSAHAQQPVPSGAPGPVMAQVAPPGHTQAPPAFDTPEPMLQNRGIAGFVILCVLVAATFGAGGYYLTAMLR